MGFLDSLMSSAYSTRDKKGRTWWLHEKMSKSGTMIYYFSKDANGAAPLPEGYSLVESTKTGIPMLKKTSGVRV